MKPGEPTAFETLLGRVRRRILWKNRIERLLRCLAVACAAAVLAAAWGLWLQRPSLAVSGALMGLGLLAGAAWGGTVKVSMPSAATWADARLDLKDLLATAWTIHASPTATEAWGRSILALAESRSRQIDAKSILPAIGSAQSWSAVALGAALALSLGMIRETIAGGPIFKSDWILDATTSPAPSVPDVAETETTRSRPAGDTALNEESNRDAGATEPENQARAAAGDPGTDGHASGSQSGVAAGVSRTAVRIAAPSVTASDTANSPSVPNGVVAGGGDSSFHGTGEATRPGMAGQQNLAAAVAPWQTAAWPAAQASALQSIQQNQIDPAYQTLVRDYFQRR